MRNQQTAKIIQINNKKKEEVVIINNYKFIKSIIIDIATGKINKRQNCPICGGKKSPHLWICSQCMDNALHPNELITAIKEAVSQYGGKIKNKSQSYSLLTQEEKEEVKNATKDWLKKHPKSTLQKLFEVIANLFPHLSPKIQALERFLIYLYNKHQKDYKEWIQAQKLAKQWFDNYPHDIRRRSTDIADDLIPFLASKGKLIKAVAEEKQRRLQIIQKKAQKIAQKYWATTPNNNQPPEKIAKRLAPDIPTEILTKALIQEKNKTLIRVWRREDLNKGNGCST